MTFTDVVVALIKILIVLLFWVNMAAVATWADRRQSAMIQDRVGPNRAVVHLPSNLVRLIVVLPPAVLAAPAFFFIALAGVIPAVAPFTPRLAFDRMVLALQCSVLVGWVSLALLAGRLKEDEPLNAVEDWLRDVDPRSIFYVGVLLHAVGFIVPMLVRDSMAALVAGAHAAGWMLTIVLFVSGIYAASRVPDGRVPVRLAGTLHAAADALKLIFKEDFVPKHADRLLHALAPMLALFPALVTFAVIPFGDQLCFLDNGNRVFDFGDLAHPAGAMSRTFQCPAHVVNLQVADLNVGILYLFAMAGTGVIGAAIAGWASDNKFSLLGGLRAASQMVSYEVAMGLSLAGLLLIYSSVRLGAMVEWQGEHAWGIFVQPFGFLLFLAALAAETKRVPFDQPEGESEIVAGYFVEYSGFKFGMFYTGEYVELITSSALLVTLFFGGYQLPFLHRDGVTLAFGDTMLFTYPMTHLAVTVLHVLVFFGKTIFVTWVQIFFRWTLPRFRYDQLMRLGWTKLLPLAIANLMLTGVVVLAIESAGPAVSSALQLVGDVTQGLVAAGMMFGAVAIIVGLLTPVERTAFLRSTSARFAAARGGTKPAPQQA